LKVAFALFDRVVAVSHAQANWIKSRGFCASEKLATIQSCVDLSEFRNISSPVGPVRIFGAIGRLDEQKGFDTLIAAFCRCTNPDIRLHIYGEGDQEVTLRNLASGDDRVIFKGFVEDPADAYAQVDAVVMPSRWEAFGLVAIEALSSGRQLICADLDGLKDHEIGGAKFIRAGSISDLVGKISELCSGGEGPAAMSPYRFSNVLEEQFVKGWKSILP
jgi:glycosyltransferase involved in cell wall biosynthesis